MRRTRSHHTHQRTSLFRKLLHLSSGLQEDSSTAVGSVHTVSDALLPVR